tara:strand:+ start:4839 stop:5471 length:633 start_codon:yes stop_codon:yes gene_type:complete
MSPGNKDRLVAYAQVITIALVIVATAIFLCSCSSAKKAIGNNSQGIESRARVSQQSAEQIFELATYALELDEIDGVPNVRDAQSQIVTLSESIHGEQEQIISHAKSIQNELHRVEDTTPWWARMMNNLAIVGLVIGVIVILWQTGIGSIIKKAVWSIGWFIPKSSMMSASADLKALDRDNEMDYRESVAIRRSSDPAYEAARKKLKEKQK